MSNYRKEVGKLAAETRWTFFKFLPIFMVIVCVLFALGFGLHSMGLLGSTVVEREIFENSYQRGEAIKAQIAMEEAVLAEIDRQLSNFNLDENTRQALEAQASAARIRIATARGKQ